MHFFVTNLFSIAKSIDVRHVRNVHPMNRLIYYAHSK